MNNLEKYTTAFCKILELDSDFNGTGIKRNKTKGWDSVGHLALITTLEDTFNIMMETEDILAFDSYNQGIHILEKYGINTL